MNHSREIEPELLQQLGLVIVRWSLIEAWVNDLFVAMTEADAASMIVVTTNVSQSSITGWIRTLLDVRQTPPDLAEEIRDVLNEVDEIRNERNAFVHGLWFTTGPSNSAIVQSTRLERREMVQDVVVTEADLRDMVSRIVHLSGRLREILITQGAYP